MLQGALNMILDGQHPVEILMEHHLRGRMSQYPLIIIPECNYLEPSFKDELGNYVREGGNLLIIGTESATLFEKELGIQSLVKVEDKPEFIAEVDKLGGIGSSVLSVGLLPGARSISTFYNSSDFKDKGKIISASVNQYGKGRVTGIYFNAGTTYLDYKSHILRDFTSSRINELLPDPLVKVSGSHLVHIAVNQIDGKMLVDLLNVAGEHANPKAIGFDEIPALQNLTVQVKTLQKPSKIILQPEGRVLDIDFQNGISKVVVPELSIYSILEIVK